jgi:hypothetical protein
MFKLLGTHLRMSSSYHPQTDGQTKQVNQCLETFLCCFVHACPRSGMLGWLLLSFGTTRATILLYANLHLKPCMVISPVCWALSLLLQHRASWMIGSRSTLAWNIWSEITCCVLLLVWRSKQISIVQRRSLMWVLWCIWNCNHMCSHRSCPSLIKRLHFKYFGPFRVLEWVGSIAYRL